VYHGEACLNCEFRGGLAARCVNGYRCMELATVDEVWEACLALLEHPTPVAAPER
jgi:hypothetical protein